MKVIIAGGRDICLPSLVDVAIKKSGFTITEVVSGGASGVDKLGELYARKKGIPIKLFPAAWSRLGPSAGPTRNAQMADYAHALIAVWDGQSRGTKNMINAASRKGLKVYIHRI